MSEHTAGNWSKRMNGFNPFVASGPRLVEYGQQKMRETSVVWRDGVVKLGIYRDGIPTRIDVVATLSGTSPSGFWQQKANAITHNEWEVMLSVAKGETISLVPFCF